MIWPCLRYAPLARPRRVYVREGGRNRGFGQMVARVILPNQRRASLALVRFERGKRQLRQVPLAACLSPAQLAELRR